MAKREPGKAMRKAASALFEGSEAEREAFLAALTDPPGGGDAIAWTGSRQAGALATVPREELPDWLPEEVDLLRPGERADASTRGEPCYQLDYSSVVAASALLVARDSLPTGPRVLDVCAAPGGKSVLASLFLQPGFLLANEVVGKRLGILRHNLRRCRIAHGHTQRLQPPRLAEIGAGAFDVCLVDAPCSGQSLLAKGKDHPGCFHPPVVKGNARRQRRILASSAATVRPGGFLLYSTCTFSRRENEGVVETFLGERADFETVDVPHLGALRSPLSEAACHRIYPHRHPGAGGFACLLRRQAPSTPEPVAPTPLAQELLAYPVEDGSKVAS